ncbi:MAG: hypothetical protein ACI97A_004131 [Planctomycetota bacterium]|jgi:hypothetical protein
MVWDQVAAYAEVDRGAATSESQETAAYRWEMLDSYMIVVGQCPWIGYGKGQISILEGLKSIDNQYLFIALIHGVPASIFLLLCMLIPAFLILLTAMKLLFNHQMGRLGIGFGGTLLGTVFTQTTVFAGTQTEQVLFLIVGMTVTMRIRLATST